MRVWALQNACGCARDHLGDHVTFHLSTETRPPLPDDLSAAFPPPEAAEPDWTPTDEPELVTLAGTPGWLKSSVQGLSGAVGDPTLELFLATSGRKAATRRTDVTLTHVRFRLKYTPHRPPAWPSRLPGQVQGTVRLSFPHGALFRRDRELGPGYHLPQVPYATRDGFPAPWYGARRSNWATTLYLCQPVVL